MQAGQRRRWLTGRGTYGLATVGAAASVWLALTIVTAGPTGSVAPALASSGQATLTTSVPATQPWTDTGLNVGAGIPLSIMVSGAIHVYPGPKGTSKY